jgi:hypothetical protein
MSKPTEAIIVRQWSVGIADNGNMTILHFAFSDREPFTFALRSDEAAQIAAAIQAQLKSPPQPNQMN